jgi:hypothetical protein
MPSSRCAILAALANHPGEPQKALFQYDLPHNNKWGYAPFDDDEVRRMFIDGLLRFVEINGVRAAVLTQDGAAASEAALRDRPSPPAATPYTFGQLLDRDLPQDIDLIFHIHVPKAGGRTVAALLRQNEFVNLDFEMNTQSFFEVVPEDRFFASYRSPPPRRAYALTGHFRLDHPIFQRAWMPHLIMTMLRDPIGRLLSHYNYTIRVPGNPWRDEVLGGMPFVEYARKALGAFGPQYSFFDHTGQGTFAPTGNATVQECLHNLVTRVGLFGMTDRFDEFAALFGYLVRRRNVLALQSRNVTDEIQSPAVDMPLKVSLETAEKKELTDLLKDDIWFYHAAVKEYERRLSDPRVRQVISDVLPLFRSCRESVRNLSAIRDPADPERRAFERFRAPQARA